MKGFNVHKRNFLKDVERSWLRCEVYRMRQDRLLEQSLKNKNLGCLLLEQESDSKAVITDLNKAADKASKDIDNLLGKMPTKMTSAIGALNTAKAEIAKNRLKTGYSLSKLVGLPMKKLSKMFGNVQILQASIANAFQTVAGALGDLGAAVKDNEEDRKRPLGELIDEYTAGDAAVPGVPNRKDFEKAVGAELKAPSGLFGGLGQGFSNMLGSLGLGKGRDVGFGLE